MIPLFAGWLVSTAVHSLSWAVLALSIGWWLGRRALPLQELLLRVALLAGLCSGTGQWLLGGPWQALPAVALVAEAALPSPALPGGALAPLPMAAPAPTAALPRRLGESPARPWAGAPSAAAPGTGLRLQGANDAAAAAFHLRTDVLVVGSAAGMAVLGLLWFRSARRLLWRRLRHRWPETDGRVLTIAAAVAHDLGMAQTPQLSRSEGLDSPVAFGLVRPEVCLPQRVHELGDEELRALFGHELAHIRRGDAFWLLLGALLQALFPWHLWSLLVRRRLCAIAELRCDTVAARSSSSVAVARCLVQVATWVTARRLPIGALAMAARPSLLRQRVEHALAERAERSLPRALLTVGLIAVVALFTAAAPGVRRLAPTAVDGRSAARAVAEPAVPADAAAAAVRRSPAPAPAAAPAPGAFDAAWQQDLRDLQSEAALVRRECVGSDDEDLLRLLDLLEVRLAAMVQAGERLEAEIARRQYEATDGWRRR